MSDNDNSTKTNNVHYLDNVVPFKPRNTPTVVANTLEDLGSHFDFSSFADLPEVKNEITTDMLDSWADQFVDFVELDIDIENLGGPVTEQLTSEMKQFLYKFFNKV